MTSVVQVLKAKPVQDIYTIAPQASVFEAISLMAEKNIGAVLVVDSGQVVGIFSERDYARKIALQQRSSQHTKVQDIMTAKVISVDSGSSVEQCLALMTEGHLRHLPVFEQGQLLGLISIGDLVKAAMQDQHNLIEQLKQYISG